VAFDKTGTLTLGRPRVVGVAAAPGFDPARVLELAAAVERHSEHPLGEAIVAHAAAGPTFEVERFAAIGGHGVEAEVHETGGADGDGARRVAILVGSERLLRERAVDLSPLVASIEAAHGRGSTVALVAVDGVAAGTIELADTIRPEARAAVEALRRDGIESWLVTGDSQAAADAVAHAVGIEPTHVRAAVLPADKASVVAELAAKGRIVAMVGDGINDAPALAAATVGIAIGSGSDVAIEAADVTLVGSDPRGVARAVELSRSTMRAIRQNLFWAFGYNVVLIPVAMGLLYPALGILLNPALAAGAMALSSVSVVLNSLRLRGATVTS
jgi:Cu+-exporting ATPase